MHYSGFILLFISVCISASMRSSNGCGYTGCNLGDPNKLNVHIVPHTHDDVGWLKTVDQYYYGARNNIQHASVQHILDSVIISLDQNSDRRFIYVEIAYFWRWWNEQTDDIRNKVKQFVNDGRLEFISGGWSMNDEASTHYNSIIDQHSLGAEFLHEQFGECGRPKIGWQIDPFGHSREVASLEAQMGFDGLFFGRADYEDWDTRFNSKTMEIIWKASQNLDRQSWLFTGILPNIYVPPDSFCFDILCDDTPIMDDQRLHDYNVPERVQSFIKEAQDQAKGYSTNHLIMTMGSDFQYENANEWFKNLDKLIKYVNAAQLNGSNINVFYSTPSCYLYALNKVNKTWLSKIDDFFPYADDPHSFWTGYFTSRAAFKGYERYANNILQVTRQINAFSNSQLRNHIFILNEAMGLAQHHDAISGTEKQEVVFDYAQRLSIGIDNIRTVINQSLSKLFSKDGINSSLIEDLFFCHTTNISECLPIQDQHRFTLTLWNPTGHFISQQFRVPVTTNYTIRNPKGQFVSTDLIAISNETKKIPGRIGNAKYELIFPISLPPLGFNTYFFEVKNIIKDQNIKSNDECILINQNLRVEIDNQGNMKHIFNTRTNLNVSFINQGFYWYQGFPGNNSESEFQASGAYIFRPLNKSAQPVSTTRTITCIKGENVEMARIVFNDWSSQEIRLYNEAQYVEIEWTIGPIPIADNIGKEIIIRYDTDIESQSKYYTDANGREVLERIRDYRPTWNYTIVEPVSGNYYPINSRIWIKDQTRQLTVLTDRSEGGASIDDGSIEIMVHRRTLYDDGLGVWEPLNETAFGQGLVVRGRHQIIVETPNKSALYHRITAQQFYMQPFPIYSLTEKTYSEYSSAYRQTWSALSKDLPLNVHLLTLDQLTEKNFLIRLEHYFELNEDETYSRPVSVDLLSIFQSLGTINYLEELTLAANLPLNNLQRLNWTTNHGEYLQINYSSLEEKSLIDTNIILNPMQIRTFKVTMV